MSVSNTRTTTSRSKGDRLSLLHCCLVFLLSASSSVSLQAQVQGTLFTTPQQRVYLDYLRDEFLARSAERGFDILQTNVSEIPTATVEQAPAPQVFSLGGIMARREGGHVIWLNGRSFTETELPNGVSLQRNEGVLGLRFTTNNGPRFIKPGQTIELGEGLVQETWQKQQTTVAVLVETEDAPAPQAVEAPAVDVEPEPIAPLTEEGAPVELDASLSELERAELQQLIEALQAMQQENTNEQ